MNTNIARSEISLCKYNVKRPWGLSYLTVTAISSRVLVVTAVIVTWNTLQHLVALALNAFLMSHCQSQKNRGRMFWEGDSKLVFRTETDRTLNFCDELLTDVTKKTHSVEWSCPYNFLLWFSSSPTCYSRSSNWKSVAFCVNIWFLFRIQCSGESKRNV
jgi:hypothetical protein